MHAKGICRVIVIGALGAVGLGASDMSLSSESSLGFGAAGAFPEWVRLGIFLEFWGVFEVSAEEKKSFHRS